MSPAVMWRITPRPFKGSPSLQTQFTDTERVFAWISRNRQLREDPEATISSAKALLYAASTMDPR
jgi:hypothetical protein